MSNAPQPRRGGMFIENTFKHALEPRRGGMFIEYVAPTELKRIIPRCYKHIVPTELKM